MSITIDLLRKGRLLKKSILLEVFALGIDFSITEPRSQAFCMHLASVHKVPRVPFFYFIFKSEIKFSKL